MKTSLVITSISQPNRILKEFAKGCLKNQWDYILIGDAASPADFKLNGCQYYGLNEQKAFDFKLAKSIPTKHYARKNLGYLQSIKNGSTIIVESDDDNLPLESFWIKRHQSVNCRAIENTGWTNVYKYFSKKHIWPRGFPLEELQANLPRIADKSIRLKNCPIQQGLANGDPDVDAVYRLTINNLITFNSVKKHIAIGKNTWCPFNSQNTTWFKEAFHLLYLPSFCSFRMTDIWRSFIAQRICWENDWLIDFHFPTVLQERNFHNLLKDFKGEVDGYLNNNAICHNLEKIKLKGSIENIEEDMISCYQVFIKMNLIPKAEITLLKAWFVDVAKYI